MYTVTSDLEMNQALFHKQKKELVGDLYDDASEGSIPEMEDQVASGIP